VDPDEERTNATATRRAALGRVAIAPAAPGWRRGLGQPVPANEGANIIENQGISYEELWKSDGWAAAWFICVLSASALGLFENESNHVGIEVAFAAVTPIAVFAVWYAGSGNFRQFVLSLNARTLTYIQSWRLAGLLFVVLATYGILRPFLRLPRVTATWPSE
jgi:hypothetical protein